MSFFGTKNKVHKKHRHVPRGYVALFFANLVFGFVGLTVRAATDVGADIFLVAASSWLIAALLVYIYAQLVSKDKMKFSFNRKTWKPLLLQGVFFGLTNVFFFSALTSTTIANAEFIHKIMPVWVMLASVYFLKEKITNLKIVSLVFAVIGLLLIFNFEIDSTGLSGDIHALIASFFFAAMVINARRLKNVSQYVSSFFQMFIGAAILVPFALAGFPYDIVNYQQFIVAIGVLAVVLTAVPQVLLLYAFKYVEASRGSLFMLLQPVSAAFIAWYLIGESLTVQSVVGILFIGLSVAAVLLPATKR